MAENRRKARGLALRRQRERHSPVTDDGGLGERATAADITHDQAALYERLRHAAEALERLKPHEARALRLRAEGYSYKEICRITAWSYTKVNRCLTEGRRTLRQRVAAIDAGRECQRLGWPLIQFTEGGSGLEELPALERHRRSCLARRARLKALGGTQQRIAREEAA